MNTITISTPGKWILLGEHAVIRGTPALVFPLLKRSLTITFTPKVGIAPLPPAPWLVPFEIATAKLREFMREQGKDLFLPEGELRISSSLPMGAGLGSSAALAVALARLAQNFNALDEVDLFRASLAIENGFHGKSSGMDIAAVLAKEPLLFQRGKEPEHLELAWQPKLFLCDSGERSSTSASVATVESLNLSNREKFLFLDQQMAHSVAVAKNSLSEQTENSFRDLASAIDLGANCFREWNLITPKIDDKIRLLREAGATAVKPTGSGGGGFVLSLWEKSPDQALLRDSTAPLIPVC